MGFREALDLSGIADQYELFNKHFERVAPGRIAKADHEAFGHHLEEHYDPSSAANLPGTGDHPERAGIGPIRCSTSRSVAALRPAFAWDPNRYYRDLGIPWPYVNASKRDLREGYQAVSGQESVWLTYCLKQLVQGDVRAAYDAMPLGKEFDDIYVQERLKMQAFDAAHERTVAGEYTTIEDVLDQWGMRVISPEEDENMSAQALDADRLNRLNESTPESVGGDWQYSFYLWKTQRWDYVRLGAWQSALIAEFDRRSISKDLAVGLMSGSNLIYAVDETVDGLVVFLNDDVSVQPGLAEQAADLVEQYLSEQAPIAQ